MKLTKGKLSKIYNKKKQTMRKFKLRSKRFRRGKTFRKKRPLNLNNKSLKNVSRRGGGDGSLMQSPGPANISAAKTLGSVLEKKAVVEEPVVEEPVDAAVGAAVEGPSLSNGEVGSANENLYGKMDIL